MNTVDFIKRRGAFAEGMKDQSFALFYSGKAPYKSKDQEYPFSINRNFFYLTGIRRQKFYLLLVKDQKKYFEYLFIEEPSKLATQWLGSRMTKEEASDLSGFAMENILYINQFDNFVAMRVLQDSRVSLTSVPRHLYLDLFRQYAMVQPESLIVFKQIIDTYPELKIKDATPIVDDLRRIKSEGEIAELKQAIGYTNEGIKALMKAVKPGLNERDLEALFEYTIKFAGSEGPSFSTILASGKNATVLHYEENNSVIEDGSLVLDDLGALSNQYCADITRTYPANGKFTDRQKQYYEIVLRCNKAIIEMMEPGVTINDLNKEATRILTEGLKEIGKIKEDSEVYEYYYHSIGHYLGLDVHDVGTYHKPLESGVVLTVEPGLYIADEGIGIRIEDNVLVTDDGRENLSRNIIKEIDEIESFMKK